MGKRKNRAARQRRNVDLSPEPGRVWWRGPDAPLPSPAPMLALADVMGVDVEWIGDPDAGGMPEIVLRDHPPLRFQG